MEYIHNTKKRQPIILDAQNGKKWNNINKKKWIKN